jgi:hypothetical protein
MPRASATAATPRIAASGKWSCQKAEGTPAERVTHPDVQFGLFALAQDARVRQRQKSNLVQRLVEGAPPRGPVSLQAPLTSGATYTYSSNTMRSGGCRARGGGSSVARREAEKSVPQGCPRANTQGIY